MPAGSCWRVLSLSVTSAAIHSLSPMARQDHTDDAQLDKLMADAHWAVTALDLAANRDRSKLDGALTDRARDAAARLTEYRNANRLTTAQTGKVQRALDLLRARLRFFGITLPPAQWP